MVLLLSGFQGSPWRVLLCGFGHFFLPASKSVLDEFPWPFGTFLCMADAIERLAHENEIISEFPQTESCTSR